MAVERADAPARNRQAILRATEELLALHGPERISVDSVAARAGVGKGTVCRRFGSRTGLFRNCSPSTRPASTSRSTTVRRPFGPGAPPRDRLLGFVDELGPPAQPRAV